MIYGVKVSRTQLLYGNLAQISHMDDSFLSKIATDMITNLTFPLLCLTVIVGVKRVSWGNPGIKWMMLKCAIKVAWRQHSPFKMVTNFQAQKIRKISRIAELLANVTTLVCCGCYVYTRCRLRPFTLFSKKAYLSLSPPL